MLRDQVTVRAPVANVGATWTHIGNDASLTDVYSKPLVTVGDRSVLARHAAQGAGPPSRAARTVNDGVSPFFFDAVRRAHGHASTIPRSRMLERHGRGGERRRRWIRAATGT